MLTRTACGDRFRPVSESAGLFCFPRPAVFIAEAKDNLTARLALLEEAKSLPWGAVWDEFCARNNVPAGAHWLAEAEAYGQQTARIRS